MQGKVSRDIFNNEMYISCQGILNYRNMKVLQSYLNSNSNLKLVLDLSFLEQINSSIARIVLDAFSKRENEFFVIKCNNNIYQFFFLIGFNKFISIIDSDSSSEPKINY